MALATWRACVFALGVLPRVPHGRVAGGNYDRSFTNFNEPALAVLTAAVKRRNFDTVSLPGGARASKKIR